MNICALFYQELHSMIHTSILRKIPQTHSFKGVGGKQLN